MACRLRCSSSRYRPRRHAECIPALWARPTGLRVDRGALVCRRYQCGQFRVVNLAAEFSALRSFDSRPRSAGNVISLDDGASDGGVACFRSWAAADDVDCIIEYYGAGEVARRRHRRH